MVVIVVVVMGEFVFFLSPVETVFTAGVGFGGTGGSGTGTGFGGGDNGIFGCVGASGGGGMGGPVLA